MRITAGVVIFLIVLLGLVMVPSGDAMFALYMFILGFGGFWVLILWLGKDH